MKRKQIGFLLRFAVLLLTFYLVVALQTVDTHVVAPFTRAITAVSGSALNLIGEEVQRSGTTLRGDRFAVDLRNGCNGLEAMVFVAAAILAYPASWKHRGIGMLAGVTLIQLVNLVRVTSLYLLGRYRPDLFEMFHLTIWQSVIFALSIFFFVAWTGRVRQVDAGASA